MKDDISPTQCSVLSSPFEIRGVNFRNRFVQAPMCAMYSAPDGSATPRNVEYYRARAAGGVGLAIVEITFTDSEGSRAFHAQLGAHNDMMIPGLSDIAEAIRSEGAIAGLQLGHCGPQRVISEGPVLAASPIPWAAGKRTPLELTADQIKKIVQDHGSATRRAVQAGFQLLEVHAAHGYLVNAFLTPATNLRTDEYGGSFENRLRFLLEIVAVMRTELGPRRLLCVRLNGDDLLEGGLGIEDYSKVARALSDVGVDLIHVSAGTYRVMDKRIPPMYLENETFAGYASPIRRASGLPVIASGTIHDMVEANRLVAAGEADFVALARPLFADPDLPRKVLSRRYDEVLPCIRCNTCIGREQSGKRAYCSINPRTGHEFEVDPRPKATRSLNIIGAGPAGIQMALVAAERGHRVTLWEKRDRIGGQVGVAAQLSFKRTLPPLLRYYETALARANVTLHLGKEMDAASHKDDLIVLATGAAWCIPPAVIEYAAIPVLGAEEAIANIRQLGPRVLVVGGGLVGMEIAWAMSSSCTVVLAERDGDFDEDVNLHARLVLIPELSRKRVDIRFHADVSEITGKTAWITENEKKCGDEFDAVVWTPRRSESIVQSISSQIGTNIIAIGECAGARGLLESTLSAYRSAIAL
jgi:2,4-dienoyl-CoA reductase-like NADH-dependent reductase (Old Yellow Enzyme family)